MARDNMIKKMLKRSEIGGTKRVKKTNAMRGNHNMSVKLKAKKNRYSTSEL